jgi:hypothetical protein
MSLNTRPSPVGSSTFTRRSTAFFIAILAAIQLFSGTASSTSKAWNARGEQICNSTVIHDILLTVGTTGCSSHYSYAAGRRLRPQMRPS